MTKLEALREEYECHWRDGLRAAEECIKLQEQREHLTRELEAAKQRVREAYEQTLAAGSRLLTEAVGGTGGITARDWSDPEKLRRMRDLRLSQCEKCLANTTSDTGYCEACMGRHR